MKIHKSYLRVIQIDIDQLANINYHSTMAVITTQQINNYYDHYRDTNIIFSREILKVLRIDPRQIYIKCTGAQWACIINSASLMSARIIVGTKGGAYAAIQKINTPVSLRFFFLDTYGKPMSLFVNGRISDIQPYMDSTDLAIATIDYNGKPPDDLIVALGGLLEAKSNYTKRSEERIPITPDSMRRLNLLKKETLVFIDKVPRNCIVRDLSFGGAKVLMVGVPQFLQNKSTILRLAFDEPSEVLELQGIVVQVENIVGRKDLVAFSMRFNEDTLPISYKIHINKFLTSFRKKMLGANDDGVEYGDDNNEVVIEDPNQKSQKPEEGQAEQTEKDVGEKDAPTNETQNA